MDYRAIDFMYLCRCDRIFVARLAELEFHIVQSSGYIQAQFERNGGFQDGDVIVELHIQSLCAAYRRSVTVPCYFERIDGYISVFDADVYGNAVYHVSLLVFEEEFFGDFGESLTVHQHKAVSLDVNG